MAGKRLVDLESVTRLAEQAHWIQRLKSNRLLNLYWSTDFSPLWLDIADFNLHSI